MKNGFVIVNYNDFKTTNILIENIKNYKIIDEIVVVDNCSTDDSLENLKKIKCKKLTVIKNEANLGYASGLNFGAKHLIKKYGECNIVFSNADIVIYKEEDLKKLIDDLNSNKKYGIVAPVIKEHTGYSRGWKLPTPIQDAILNIVWIHKFLRPKMLFYKEKYFKGIVKVDVILGCFFLMNSKILESVDFFDENTFLFYEENIMSKKLQEKNYDVVIDSDVEVFHNHSVTIDKNVKKLNKLKMLKKSQIYFQKNYNKANKFEMALLKITNKVTIGILSIVYKIKK